jgi:hypothetical protein
MGHNRREATIPPISSIRRTTSHLKTNDPEYSVENPDPDSAQAQIKPFTQTYYE